MWWGCPWVSVGYLLLLGGRRGSHCSTSSSEDASHSLSLWWPSLSLGFQSLLNPKINLCLSFPSHNNPWISDSSKNFCLLFLVGSWSADWIDWGEGERDLGTTAWGLPSAPALPVSPEALELETHLHSIVAQQRLNEARTVVVCGLFDHSECNHRDTSLTPTTSFKFWPMF